MSDPAQDAHAEAVRHYIELADGDARVALQLLSASGLGVPLENAEPEDFAVLRTPDAAALMLARLVVDEDLSTVYELLQLAGYDPRGWGEALLLADPSSAPNPEWARQLLHGASGLGGRG